MKKTWLLILSTIAVGGNLLAALTLFLAIPNGLTYTIVIEPFNLLIDIIIITLFLVASLIVVAHHYKTLWNEQRCSVRRRK